MKKHLIDGAVGFVVSFFTLIAAWWFSTTVNAPNLTLRHWALFTAILFAIYMITPFYRKRHQKDPRSFWLALFSFLIGAAVLYLCLLLIVNAAVAWMRPSFPG